MKLVDKDDILRDIEDLQKSPWFNDGHGAPSNERYFVRKEAVEIVRDMCVKVAPTIDAIPVEWLEDKELDYRTIGDKMFSDAFAVVIGEWQKEQGVR